MRFIRHLEPWQNVAASARAVLNSNLVLGNIIERVYLAMSGTTFDKANLQTAAHTGGLRVRLNGKVVFGDITGSDLDLLNTYLFNNQVAKYLTVDFTEPDSRSIQGELMGAIDTNAAGVTSFVMEADINGTAVAPVLDSWVQLRDPASVGAKNGFNPALAPLLRALIPTVLTPTAAAEQQYQINYGSGGNSLIKRLAFFSTILTNVRVKRNSLDMYEYVANALASFVEGDYAKKAQANMYVLDWLMDNNQADAVPTRNADGTLANFQFLLTTSGAGSINAYTDAYSILGGI